MSVHTELYCIVLYYAISLFADWYVLQIQLVQAVLHNKSNHCSILINARLLVIVRPTINSWLSVSPYLYVSLYHSKLTNRNDNGHKGDTFFVYIRCTTWHPVASLPKFLTSCHKHQEEIQLINHQERLIQTNSEIEIWKATGIQGHWYLRY